jgi:prepilin-type processing-associated H-X9-DG protein
VNLASSRQWQSELLAAQKHILERDGAQGGGLTKVLRHFSFAKQRYESYAAPQRHWCCLLGAVALVLACRASDARRPLKEREEYVDRLLQIGPSLGLKSGLSADWGLECRALIGQFDVTDHDPSKTHHQIESWIGRAQALFMDGHVLHATNEGKTCTAIAVQTLMESPEIRFQRDRVHSLWGPSAKAEATKAISSMQTIFACTAERLKAEFPSDSVLLSFAAFDLNSWHRAYTLQRQRELDKSELAFGSLTRKIRRLSAAYPFSKIDSESAVAEFRGVALGLAHQHDSTWSSEPVKDSRPYWANAVAANAASTFLNRPLQFLHCLAGWYLSVLDGTSVI